jgi:hypothetical protein
MSERRSTLLLLGALAGPLYITPPSQGEVALR